MVNRFFFNSTPKPEAIHFEEKKKGGKRREKITACMRMEKGMKVEIGV